MQGRLSPPVEGKIQAFPLETWRDEFPRAAHVGLATIEWIYEERFSDKNPLSLDSTIQEVVELVRATGVSIEAVCADYFLDVPYLTSSENTKRELRERLAWLISRAAQVGAKYIDLPFVDKSAIPGATMFPEVIEFVRPSLIEAERSGITITLETSLNAEDFRKLLSQFNHPRVMANYDTGNSASLGYDCDEEFEAYGRWIRTVHIKDRVLGGTTVPLGTGDADFNKVFRNLVKFDYRGTLTLQAAREGDEVKTVSKNMLFIEKFTGGRN